MGIGMDNYKILIHGHDATNIVASFELLHYQAVINYIDGNVASFNRADVQVINEDGKDIAAPIKLGE